MKNKLLTFAFVRRLYHTVFLFFILFYLNSLIHWNVLLLRVCTAQIPNNPKTDITIRKVLIMY